MRWCYETHVQERFPAESIVLQSMRRHLPMEIAMFRFARNVENETVNKVAYLSA